MHDSNWPELHYQQWSETYRTIHLWTQIIGKIRLSKSPWTNHSWHSTLYVTERGLSTSVIHDEHCSFSLELDFCDHHFKVRRSEGETIRVPLREGTIAGFYQSCLDSLKEIGIDVSIHPHPNELMENTSFPYDLSQRPYDADAASRHWRILLNCDRIFKMFRSRFAGKVSPVHFFWGSFDLAVSRFSGRKAPEHPGGVPNLPDLVAREAYSHEVSSCGFWPGNEQYPHAAFYSYAYPTPEGFADIKTVPGAFFEPNLREFILPYEVVRKSANPDGLILDFCQSTYEAAADLANWDRELLEESTYLRALQEKEKTDFYTEFPVEQMKNFLNADNKFSSKTN